MEDMAQANRGEFLSGVKQNIRVTAFPRGPVWQLLKCAAYQGVVMREIGAGEAETNLGRLLEWVEAGEEVIITRSGKAVARLLPPAATIDTARVREAVEGIRAMRKGVTLGGLSIKDLMNEGRP